MQVLDSIDVQLLFVQPEVWRVKPTAKSLAASAYSRIQLPPRARRARRRFLTESALKHCRDSRFVVPQKPLFDVTDGNTLNGRETLKGKAKSPLYNASLLNKVGNQLRRIFRVGLSLAGHNHVEEKTDDLMNLPSFDRSIYVKKSIH